MNASAPKTSPGVIGWTAVVLAGGLGKRIRHLAPDVPKPMIPVCGRPFLEWIIRYLRRQGVRQVVVSTGYRGEVIERHFSRVPVADMRVTCIAEPSALGTAGGFFHAAKLSRASPDAWLVMNGDSLVLTSLDGFASLMGSPDVQGVLMGVKASDTSRFGTLRFDPNNRLTSFMEKSLGAGVINAGVYLLKPALLGTFSSAGPLSFENDVFPRWLDQGLDFRVHVTESPFLDIGTPESLPLAESFVARHLSLIDTP